MHNDKLEERGCQGKREMFGEVTMKAVGRLKSQKSCRHLFLREVKIIKNIHCRPRRPSEAFINRGY
jgi:hypothetical protein